MSTVTATAAAHHRESCMKRHIDNFVCDVISPLFWHDVFFEMVVTGIVTCGVVWALTSLNPVIYQLSTTHFAAFAAALVLGYSEGYVTINGAFFNPVVVLAFFITRRISAARCELVKPTYGLGAITINNYQRFCLHIYQQQPHCIGQS